MGKDATFEVVINTRFVCLFLVQQIKQSAGAVMWPISLVDDVDRSAIFLCCERK